MGILRAGRLVVTQSVDALRAQAVRRMDLTFVSSVPVEQLRRTDGVREVSVAGHTATSRSRAPPPNCSRLPRSPEPCRCAARHRVRRSRLALGAISGRRTAAAVAAYVLYAAGMLVPSVGQWQQLSPFQHALTGGPLGAGLPPAYLWMRQRRVIPVLAAMSVLDRRDRPKAQTLVSQLPTPQFVSTHGCIAIGAALRGNDVSRALAGSIFVSEGDLSP